MAPADDVDQNVVLAEYAAIRAEVLQLNSQKQIAEERGLAAAPDGRRNWS
jgi:hypothetical protein